MISLKTSLKIFSRKLSRSRPLHRLTYHCSTCGPCQESWTERVTAEIEGPYALRRVVRFLAKFPHQPLTFHHLVILTFRMIIIFYLYHRQCACVPGINNCQWPVKKPVPYYVTRKRRPFARDLEWRRRFLHDGALALASKVSSGYCTVPLPHRRCLSPVLTSVQE